MPIPIANDVGLVFTQYIQRFVNMILLRILNPASKRRSSIEGPRHYLGVELNNLDHIYKSLDVPELGTLFDVVKLRIKFQLVIQTLKNEAAGTSGFKNGLFI